MAVFGANVFHVSRQTCCYWETRVRKETETKTERHELRADAHVQTSRTHFPVRVSSEWFAFQQDSFYWSNQYFKDLITRTRTHCCRIRCEENEETSFDKFPYCSNHRCLDENPNAPWTVGNQTESTEEECLGNGIFQGRKVINFPFMQGFDLCPYYLLVPKA